MENEKNNPTHSGSGDNIAGDKIINNDNSVTHHHYYGQQNPPQVIPLRLNNAPFSLPETIFGRKQDVENIREHLTEKKQLLLVNSMGGVGKTTTALYYAYKYQNQYAHIIWVNGENEVENALLNDADLLVNLDIAQQITDLIQNKQRDLAIATVKRALFALPKPVLWLIDNANEDTYNTIKQWQNTNAEHHFLITSRDKHHEKNAYHLDYLSETAALALFYEHAGKTHKNDENDALLQPLLHNVWYHTLAIILIAKTFKAKNTNDLTQYIKNTAAGT